MTPDYSRIPRRMRPKDSMPLPSLLLLMAISAIPLACSSIYLPALTEIGKEIIATPQQLIDTMTYYMVTFAISSLSVGPIIDMYGRRRPILVGLLLFGIGTVVCATAPNIDILLLGRILQGIGGAVMPVATRAMLRDMLIDKTFIVMIGWHGIVVGLAPIIAPLLGGEITPLFGWRANFWLIEGACIILLIITFFRMGETHHKRLRIEANVKSLVLPMIRVATDRRFLVVTIALCALFSFVAVLIALTPFMVKAAGWAERFVGIFLLAYTVVTLIGRTIGISALKKHPERWVWMRGVIIMFIGGVILLAGGLLMPHNMLVLLPGLMVFAFGAGVMTPLGNKGAMSAVPGLGGISAALLLFITVLFQAVGSWISGYLLAFEVPGPLAIGVAGITTSCVTLWFAKRSAYLFKTSV